MPIYETIFITRQDATEARVNQIVSDLSQLIDKEKGEVNLKEYWGLRQLAYPIGKVHKGHYSLLVHTSPADIVSKIERFMRNNEQIIRFLSTKIESVPTEPSPLLREEENEENPNQTSENI